MARRIAANSLLDNRMDDVRSSEPANATRRRWVWRAQINPGRLRGKGVPSRALYQENVLRRSLQQRNCQVATPRKA
ncbi:hypothetical protein F441_11113 [Phytophthora nicotianae CJ01A1]|uniref:Uncharacterized protein n=5 Tax=Phytophthora nicotianae TaxID=4792 RepID=W2Q3J9_PHYN3|nr:hypothetical protein PPTG_23182 [Phytophthora nicotianae INRA-310]ETI44038.1 hypothetical protein F443_11202 [Phytophthora nicotianae P1569]ETK84072.1 hypothetical protein L915_10914 [Phytophthora nicotianae]ETP13872.1 hypothetical protein F441_11113 [Phytophthora nicotianae CJ01A1]ETP41944.1 hypothetical protein F442_11106 [Phytophthora nicotianae P10297]ETL37509.1 hypothetical protein L916_10808 [Phytophthora nicotianae]